MNGTWMNSFAGALAMLVLPWIGSSALADGLTVEEIVQRTEQVAYYQGDDGKARVTMTITDGQGRVRTRRFQSCAGIGRGNGEGAATRNTSSTSRTRDVRNTVFMVWKHPEHDDDRWLYLPAPGPGQTHRRRRQAHQLRRLAFPLRRYLRAQHHGRPSPADRDHGRLLCAGKRAQAARTRRLRAFQRLWIHRDSFVPVRVEYFDAQDRKYREYEALEVATIQGHPTVMKSRMKDLRDGGETVLAFDRWAYDLGLPEGIFSERYLRHPPVSYLK